MPQLRIDTQGLTLKEVIELEGVVRGLESVGEVKFTPFLPGAVHHRSFPPQAAIGVLHLLIRLADGAAFTVGATATQHVYKKIGEGIVDKVWDAVKAKLSGTSSQEVAVTLYGPDGKIIKNHKGRR